MGFSNLDGTYKPKFGKIKRPDLKEKMKGPFNPAWKGGISAGDNRKDYIKQKKKELKKRKKEYIHNIKLNVPCADCKVVYPPHVMDFDHLDGSKKKAKVPELVNNGYKTINEEIAKCEIVCSNCHRQRTHDRLLAP